MARVIDVNGHFEVLCSESDFSRVIEEQMGWEAAEYFNELLQELDSYREKEDEKRDQ
jgi:hypothetical protein